MKKAYHLTLIVCLGIIAFATLMAMEMLADGVYFGVPITLANQGNVTTTSAVYYPGDDVEATVSYCKSRDLREVINWQLVDTYVRFYPSSRADLPTGFRIAMSCTSCRRPADLVSIDVSAVATIRFRFICPSCGRKIQDLTTMPEIIHFQQQETRSRATHS